MNELQNPRWHQLEYLWYLLSDPTGGSNFQLGVEFDTWLGEEEVNPATCVCLNEHQAEDDMFTNAIMGFVSSSFYRSLGPKRAKGRVVDENSGYTSCDESRARSISGVIVTVISVHPPSANHPCVEQPHDNDRKGSLQDALHGRLRRYLGILHNSKRVEILAATATQEKHDIYATVPQHS